MIELLDHKSALRFEGRVFETDEEIIELGYIVGVRGQVCEVYEKLCARAVRVPGPAPYRTTITSDGRQLSRFEKAERRREKKKARRRNANVRRTA